MYESGGNTFLKGMLIIVAMILTVIGMGAAIFFGFRMFSSGTLFPPPGAMLPILMFYV